MDEVPDDFFDEPSAKKSKTDEKAFTDQQPKKTNDKSKIKSSKPSTDMPSSSFNKFAVQARVEKDDAARPVKDKTNVKNKVADLSKLVGGNIRYPILNCLQILYYCYFLEPTLPTQHGWRRL